MANQKSKEAKKAPKKKLRQTILTKEMIEKILENCSTDAEELDEKLKPVFELSGSSATLKLR